MNLGIICVLAAIGWGVCCLAQVTPPAGAAPAQPAGQAVSDFGMDLYQQLAGGGGGGGGDIFVSPYSIHSALGMTLAGARGATAQQMQKVLKVDNADAAGRQYRQLLEHLDQVKQQTHFELNIANSLWGEQTTRFLPSFVQLLEKQYGSQLHQVDYRNNAEAARRQINAWVSDQTHWKIPELIAGGILTRDTRLVLVNAIYFKAAWQEPFEKQATADAPFWVEPAKSIQARMMHQSLHARYAENQSLQMLELPYAGGAESMLILLPRQRDGLSAVQKQLSSDMIQRLYESSERREVRVSLPSFTIRQQLELGPTLAGMGMPDAFGGHADFSGMAGEANLLISNVIHEAYVAVDENGTEAAAATAVAARAMAMLPGEPAVFTADHPFFFAIRDNQSSAILFLGRLTQPKAP